MPLTKKGRKRKGRAEADEAEQQAIDFDVTGERIEENSLINDIRRRVELWRAQGYNGVTPVTRKLLLHWADPLRENRVLFCQREAAETAIFLAEVAGRHGEADYRTRLEPENRRHNDGLPRIGLKMATGAGKTVVMAMLIAWQTANKAYSPRDARYTNRFLVVTPGITIRDRLRVLQASTSSVNRTRGDPKDRRVVGKGSLPSTIWSCSASGWARQSAISWMSWSIEA